MPKTMKTGKLYRIKGDPYGPGWYAKPAKYANGATIGDCWIVNKQGKRHPDWNAHPVPMHANNLEPVN